MLVEGRPTPSKPTGCSASGPPDAKADFRRAYRAGDIDIGNYSEQPLADSFLDGGDFLIGFVKPGLGRLRAIFGRYHAFFRAHNT